MTIGILEVSTGDDLRYEYFTFSNGIVNFKVRAPNDAHLILCGERNETHPVIEVFLGGWGNTKSVIRYNQQKPDVYECETPHILDAHQFRAFWVRVTDNVITVGNEGEAAAFLSWRIPEPFYINYFGVCTGWGATGEWVIDDPEPNPAWQEGPAPPAQLRVDFGGGGAPCWVNASGGAVPAEAVRGGMDGEPLYVARVRHETDLIPGKLVQSHGVAYVSYGGTEHPYSEYEVLCGCQPRWVHVDGDNLPPNAIPAGETGDGETLFVGRVNHEGALTIGKVQPSHGACYIPYGGQEMAFPSYEVMTD